MVVVDHSMEEPDPGMLDEQAEQDPGTGKLLPQELAQELENLFAGSEAGEEQTRSVVGTIDDIEEGRQGNAFYNMCAQYPPSTLEEALTFIPEGGGLRARIRSLVITAGPTVKAFDQTVSPVYAGGDEGDWDLSTLCRMDQEKRRNPQVTGKDPDRPESASGSGRDEATSAFSGLPWEL